MNPNRRGNNGDSVASGDEPRDDLSTLVDADTIAAISTPPGRGAIGMVRVSGRGAGEIAHAMVKAPLPPRVATHARFVAHDGETLDSGLALWFPAPRSHTGEDVLELHGHGGPVVLDRVLTRALELGARPARPGEFTERAFLNGKLDLAQAEAVADLIDASTEEAARLARRSLDGALSRRLDPATAGLIELRTFLEGALDFPDEEIPELPGAPAAQRIADIRAGLVSARDAGERGNLLREGFTVVLAGRPNVGKSSLLNRLTGQDRAIVTATPGTTRDTLHETIQVDGMPLRIIDTAGLHATEDAVEQAGIARTWAAVEEADAVLAMLDDRVGLEAEDHAILARLPARLPRLIVHNKIDLTGTAPGDLPCGGGRKQSDGSDAPKEHHLALSAKTGAGLDRLHEQLKALAGHTSGTEGLFMARRRHLVALDEALAALDRAHASLEHGQPGEIVAEELRLAQRALGEITGEFTTDDLLGRIFATFCIGK